MRDLTCFYFGGGGTRARLAVFEGKRGNVDQVLDRGMDPCLGDDRSSIGVTDEHHFTIQLVKCLMHTCGVGMQVAE